MIKFSASAAYRHRFLEYKENLHEVEAYLAMCKGAFEGGKENFETAIAHLEEAREALPTAYYPLRLLCESYLAADISTHDRKMTSARIAAEKIQEEIPKEVFNLVKEELDFFNQYENHQKTIRNARIIKLLEKEINKSESESKSRYSPIHDDTEKERRHAKARELLRNIRERKDRDLDDLLRGLRGS